MSDTSTANDSATAPTPSAKPSRLTHTFLGRLAQAVRGQNWFAVALEVCIVVLGVFLGIQLGNWNSERQQRALGDEYLQRIAEDLGSDVANFEKRIRNWQEATDELDVITGYLATGDLSGQTPLGMLNVIYGEAGWSPFVPNRTTFDELQSTGMIRLIRNPDLRRNVSAYYSNIEQFGQFYSFDTPVREMVRGAVSPPLQHHLWTECFSDEVWRKIGQGRTACPPFGDKEAVEAALAALRADPDLVEALQYTNSIRLVAIMGAQTELANCKALIARIDAEL